jgi:hypothetical protein
MRAATQGTQVLRIPYLQYSSISIPKYAEGNDNPSLAEDIPILLISIDCFSTWDDSNPYKAQPRPSHTARVPFPR